MDAEKKFILNLTRLAGLTEAVSVDAIVETLAYISNNAVLEAQFLEECYLSVVFEDDDFIDQAGIHVCSVSNFINRVHEAIKANDGVFLGLLRSVHRRAREFLRRPEIKQRIQDLIIERQESLESKAIWNAITALVAVVQNFPRNYHARLFADFMPRITERLPMITESASPTTSSIVRYPEHQDNQQNSQA